MLGADGGHLGASAGRYGAKGKGGREKKIKKTSVVGEERRKKQYAPHLSHMRQTCIHRYIFDTI